MQFFSSTAISVGPYESMSLVGAGHVVKNPVVLPSLYTSFAGVFQIANADCDIKSVPVQVDVQFTSNIVPREQKTHNIHVSLVRMPAIPDATIVAQVDVIRPFEELAKATFSFGPELKTYHDEGAGYLNVWSLRKDLEVLSSHLHEGDRLALSIEHSNMELTLLVVGTLVRR